MKYIPFNFDWKFTEGPERFFMMPGADDGETVNLPHDYVINKPRDPQTPSAASSGFLPGGEGGYTKVFDMPAEWQNKTVLLAVDGAYMNSETKLNGDIINIHPYGYTAFQVDMTQKLLAELPNTLKISCKCFQPNSRWYSGAGLYREVGILVGGKRYVNPWDVFVTTPDVSVESARVHVAFDITNVPGDDATGAIEICVINAAGETVACKGAPVAISGAATHKEMDITVADPALWDIDDPNMYKLKFVLKADGETCDEGETTFGIRKIEIDAHNGFRLNGRKLKLRGGCIHHDQAQLGACAYPDAEERKIRKLKEAGYMAIRTAHNPPSRAMLDVCDRLGMLVLEESFDMWRTGKNSLDYHLWFEDWWQRDTAAMVKRDRNHPCIYSWSIGNEIQEMLNVSDGAYWAKVQADYVRSLDPTRPVSASANGFVNPKPGEKRKPHDFKAELSGKPVMGLPKDGEDTWGDQTEKAWAALDIAGYNYMYGRYASDAKRFPERVIHATETHPYFTYDYWQAVLNNDNCIGDYIWTAYDNLGEAGAGRVLYDTSEMLHGLIGGWPWLSCYQGDFDLIGCIRPQGVYRRVMWGLDKGVHMFTTPPERTGKQFFGMGWHWEDIKPCWTFADEYIGKPVKVQAYADCDEVEFIVNGVSAGRVKPEEYKAVMEVNYQPGTLETVAYKNGAETARDTLTTTGRTAAIALAPEKPAIAADGMALGYIDVTLTDSQGNYVNTDDVQITVKVSGAGTFAALGSANPCTEENYTDTRRTFDGRALICVRAGREAGDITVEVTAEGLPVASTVVRVG